MSDTDRSTGDEPVTTAQRRHLFEELIGATVDGDRRLWRALDERDAATDARVDELCRHFPGLTLAMRIVWEQHIQRGDLIDPCCVCEPAPAEEAAS